MELTLEKIRQFRLDMLDEVLSTKDPKNIISFMKEWGLVLENNKIVPDSKYKNLWEIVFGNWDRRQLVRKILLNSALINQRP